MSASAGCGHDPVVLTELVRMEIFFRRERNCGPIGDD
jgi:hypothetical protein